MTYKAISGAEAKLAWANGEEVEISAERTIVFSSLNGNFKLDVFDNPKNMFRIKPRTMVNQQQGLISGAEALRALADGKDVQVRVFNPGKYGEWINIFDAKDYKLKDLLSNDFNDQFRIKPHTLTINIEIPAPFVPKEGEECCYLSDESTDGYHTINYNSERWTGTAYGLYRPCDIKQVVAALRGAICP